MLVLGIMFGLLWACGMVTFMLLVSMVNERNRTFNQKQLTGWRLKTFVIFWPISTVFVGVVKLIHDREVKSCK